MKNKVLSVLLGMAVCTAGLVSPVSAQESEEVIYTFDGYVCNEKNEKVPDNWIEVGGYSNDPKNNRVEIFSATGLFGKESGDTVYKIAPYWNADSNPASLRYQTRYVPEASVNDKRYVKVSYEMAVDNVDANRWLQLMFEDSAAVRAETKQLFSINRDGNTCVLYVDGEKSDYPVPSEKWMRFDVVCDMTTLTADLYVDGNLKKGNVSLGIPEGYVPAVLEQYIFGVNALKNSAGTAVMGSETYFDNVSYLMTDTKPEITAYTAPDVIDFQDYEGGTPEGYNAGSKTYEPFTIISPNDKQSFAPYDGLRGTDATDRSLRIKADSGKSADGNNPQYAQYRWITNIIMDSSNAPYFHFSTEFAMEGAAMNRGITLQGYGGEKSYDYPIIDIKTINNEQVVYVGGNKTDLQLPMSVLMKFDVVINWKARTFDLYINGEKKFENQAMNGLSYFGEIRQVILFSNQIWEYAVEPTEVWEGNFTAWNGYVASETYYDNMECGKYYEYPQIEAYTSPSLTCMTAYDTQINPIDGTMEFGHWVPLRGYDSEYYYYAQNVSMPADNATRAYKATFGKLNDSEAIVTNENIFEVKNGNATAYGKDFGSIVPTDREFKLSFLFDIVNKTYNVYVDDVPAVVEMPFETNNAGQPIREFSSIDTYVTADGQPAVVKETPVASGAYIDIPQAAQYEPYTLVDNGTSVEAKVFSNKLGGTPILAAYSAGKLENAVIGSAQQREISIAKSAGSNVKFMLWDDLEGMQPVFDAINVE